MLPNLIVIGAAKCGTTSLHHYLGRHPEITMSTPKELHFFVRHDWREHLDWYGRHFPPGTPVRGESSCTYSRHPAEAGVAERIRELVPEVRLVYAVGDPLRRIEADYAQRRWRGVESRPIEQAIGPPGDVAASPLVAASLYASQLERYLRLFPDSQLLVLDQDDLRHRRRETLREVFRFLGVDESFESPEFELELNVRGELRTMGPVAETLWERVLVPAARAAPGRLRARLREPSRRLLSERVPSPRLSPAIRSWLGPVLAAEAERLRTMTGKRFAGWSV